MASKDTMALATAEMEDEFVIPQKFGQQMMLFSMASGGQPVITLDGLTKLACGMAGSVIPMAKGMVEQYKTQGLEAVPVPISAEAKSVIDDTIAKTFAKAVTPAALQKFLEPLFNIIDVNDSGTISKREFFHVARIATFVAESQGPARLPAALAPRLQSLRVQAKEVLDMVFDLLDTNHDAAISKAEIATYIHRIAHAVGKLALAVVELVTELFLNEAVFDAVLLDAFKFAAPQLKATGADVFDDNGDVSYAKCAPFLAMAEVKAMQLVKAGRETQSPAQLASIKVYMDMEKKMIEGAASKTDASGNISKADLIAVQKESLKTACSNMKQQFTAILSGLPPAAQGPAMMVSGFVNPTAIFEKVMTAEPFYALPFTDAIFKNFGTGDKLNMTSLTLVAKMAMEMLTNNTNDGESKSADDDSAVSPTHLDRTKLLFGLLDGNADGAISPKEAARVLGGFARCWASAFSVLISFYLEFLGHPDFVTGLLSAAEGMAPMAVGMLGLSASDAPKFPLQKSFFEGIIAKMLGSNTGVKGADSMKKELFNYCDVDGDGVLTLEEFNRIEAGRLSQAMYDGMCDMKNTKLATYEIFESMYDNGYDLNADYERLLASKDLKE